MQILDLTLDAIGNITAFGLDPVDNLTSVTDPRSLVTSYQYNGLGDLKQLTSPDTGLTVYGFSSVQGHFRLPIRSYRRSYC